jgi:hypothetical protein
MKRRAGGKGGQDEKEVRKKKHPDNRSVRICQGALGVK